MNQETIKAIEGSVRKHDCIAQGLKTDNAASDCPLCHMFKPEERCEGCPVMKATTEWGCGDTPYDGYRTAHFGIPHMAIRHLHEYENLQDAIISGFNFCDAVEAEVEFLVSLLPEDHEWRIEC